MQRSMAVSSTGAIFRVNQSCRMFACDLHIRSFEYNTLGKNHLIAAIYDVNVHIVKCTPVAKETIISENIFS